jgi:alpha 1,2-mannosyltransferase
VCTEYLCTRWGDAPVHSIAVALMLKREEVHWFYDIGYKHDFFEHCPIQEDWLVHGKCYCEPTTSFGKKEKKTREMNGCH